MHMPVGGAAGNDHEIRNIRQFSNIELANVFGLGFVQRVEDQTQNARGRRRRTGAVVTHRVDGSECSRARWAAKRL